MTSRSAHRPRKRFGQNFLHDKNIINKIIHATDFDSSLPIVEVGPGRGALTGELLTFHKNIHAIEIDRDLAHELDGRFKDFDNFELYCTDALKFDYSTIQPQPIQVIGNLPYNISTPLLFHLLKYLEQISFMLFMLQEEVVDRICAAPGSSDYGRLSVMIQSRCQVKKLFEVPANAFTPVPKVSSAIVFLRPAVEVFSRIDHPEIFEKLVRQAFSQRRKTIRKALMGLLSREEIESVGLASDLRPAQLSLSDFISLSNAVKHP